VETKELSRRTLLKGGGAAVVGLTALQVAGPSEAFPGEPGREEVLPWLDQPTEPPISLPNLLVWEELDSFYTPADDFFVVSHYEQPKLDPSTYRLTIDGLVSKPRSWSLDQLKARHYFFARARATG